MQQWEYTQSVASMMSSKDWDAKACDGWELVTVSDDIAYFKRPVHRGGEIVLKMESAPGTPIDMTRRLKDAAK
jgi:hypothetical protein